MPQAQPQRSLFAIVCCGLPPTPRQGDLRPGQSAGRAAHDAEGAAVGQADDFTTPTNGIAATDRAA